MAYNETPITPRSIMFKNRSFQVKMVKDANKEQSTPESIFASLDFSAIDKIVKEYAKHIAIGGVLVYAAVKTVDTIGTIAVNYTNPANR